MNRKEYQEWEATRRIPFKGITADRLREIGIEDKAIRKMTFAQADDILREELMNSEEPEPPKKYICRYCGAPVYKSEVVVADEIIICRKCAFGG